MGGKQRRKEKRRKEGKKEGKKRKKKRKEKKEEGKEGGRPAMLPAAAGGGRRRPEVAGVGRRWAAKAPSPSNGGAILVKFEISEF